MTEVNKTDRKIRIKQVGSPIRSIDKHSQTLIGLGLGRIGRERVLENTPAVRGMIRVVQHLIKVSPEK